jgi:rhodanese-related sulfurtransferase
MKLKVVGVFLLSFISFISFSQSPVLEPKEFVTAMLQVKKVQLLDVRTKDEYSKAHLSNSMLADWLDKEEFKRRTEFLDKSAPVYVYCMSGGRS